LRRTQVPKGGLEEKKGKNYCGGGRRYLKDYYARKKRKFVGGILLLLLGGGEGRVLLRKEHKPRPHQKQTWVLEGGAPLI